LYWGSGNETYYAWSVISLQWDTAAQERFLSLSDSIYRKVDGIFIAYDITDEVRTIKVKSRAVAVVKAYHKSPRTLCHWSIIGELIACKIDIKWSKCVYECVGEHYLGNRKYHNLGNRKQMVDILCNKNYTMHNRGNESNCNNELVDAVSLLKRQ